MVLSSLIRNFREITCARQIKKQVFLVLSSLIRNFVQSNSLLMKKIVVLTGAGMSVESGLSTFRDADGLWENYPVSRVATHEAWEADPEFVNAFYNMLRTKYTDVKPNEGHLLVAKLEEQYDVTVVTHNPSCLRWR